MNPFYTYGAMALALPAWSSATAIGIVAGNILPASAVSALSVALYGMFLAIVIPPTKKNKVLGGVVLISFVFSGLFTWLPVTKTLSASMRTIILTIVIAGAAAVLFPVKDETQEGDKNDAAKYLSVYHGVCACILCRARGAAYTDPKEN